MTRRHLHLASNRLFWQVGDPFIWPYFVDLSVNEQPPLIGLAEGVAHGAHGGLFSPSEALTPKWTDLITKAEAEWLLPYIQRLASGETVTEGELIAHFRSLHGRDPQITEQRSQQS